MNSIKKTNLWISFLLILFGMGFQSTNRMGIQLESQPEGILVNAPPEISDIPDQTTSVNNPVGPIPFTVSDLETPAEDLVVWATSSDQMIVSDSGILLTGVGENRTITPTPEFDATGVTTITVSVSDGLDTSSDTFDLTVTAPNSPPTISSIPDQVADMDTSIGPLAFTVGDEETAADELIVTAWSSDEIVISNGGIELGGVGENQTITLTPVSGQTGLTTITVEVSDDLDSSNETFQVLVADSRIFLAMILTE